jgi:hypothetical protein
MFGLKSNIIALMNSEKAKQLNDLSKLTSTKMKSIFYTFTKQDEIYFLNI